MAKMFSLAWRYLLVAALVLNPMAGTGMAVAAATAGTQQAGPASGDSVISPCHAMAMHQDAAAKTDDSKPNPSHGCDCGNTACQFACCAVIAFEVPLLRLAPLAHAQAPAAPDPSETASPPRSRMIRPPIA